MAKNNSKQKDKLAQDLDASIAKLDGALKSLKLSVDVIQKGDGKYPFWNGTNACSVMKTTLTLYQTNHSLLQRIKECRGSLKK